MKPGTHLSLACLALVVATGFCAYEYWRVRTLESRPVPAQPQPSTATRKFARSRPASPSPSASTAVASVAPGLPERVKQIIDKSPRGPGGVPMVRPEALFADLPALKLAFSKAAEAQQRLGYAQFLSTLKLSPAEEQRFIAILANREATWGDIRATATEQGLSFNNSAVAQLDEKNFAETESNLQSLLGPQRYEQLQSYRDTLDARLGLFSLSALVYTSYGTDQPLTLEQMNRLATLSTDTGVLSYDRAGKMPNGPDFDRALAEAQKFLTPAQLEVFGLLVDQRQISYIQSKIASDRRR